MLRLRTPTIVRPEERRSLAEVARPWPSDSERDTSGSSPKLGAGRSRRRRGLRRELLQPAHRRRSCSDSVPRRIVAVGRADDRGARCRARHRGMGRASMLFVYGRPEGMTIEHCVLSAAFDREPTTCRDLCVQKHPVRRADRPGWVHVRRRDGFRVPESTPALTTHRRRRSICLGCGSRAFAGSDRCSTCRAIRYGASSPGIAPRSMSCPAPRRRTSVALVRELVGQVHVEATSRAACLITAADRFDDGRVRRTSLLCRRAQRVSAELAARSRPAPRCASRSATRRFGPGQERAVDLGAERPRHAGRAAHRRRQVAVLPGAGADAAGAHRRRSRRSSR